MYTDRGRRSRCSWHKYYADDRIGSDEYILDLRGSQFSEIKSRQGLIDRVIFNNLYKMWHVLT
jgi:hypothetical protein